MSGNPDANDPEVWLRYAADDLKAAAVILQAARGGAWRVAAFQAQQCAEKALKAYLIAREVDFPYTHHIGLLLERCARFGIWSVALTDAESLTLYATISRYPGEAEPVTKREAARALKLAENVLTTVRRALRAEGLHPKVNRR